MVSYLRYNFVFVEIPKAATTSMRARLFRLGTADPHAQQSSLIEYPHAQHYNIREYRVILGDELDSRFKFSFVRNPWDKLVSSYTRECSNWRNRSLKREWILDPKEFQKWVVTALVPKRRAPNRRYPHYLGKYPRLAGEPQLNMITDKRGNIAVDFIGRFENVVEDFETILIKINRIHPLPAHKYWVLPKLNKSHGADKHYSFYYNDETIEKVREIYRKDIEHFGYTYEDRTCS